MTCHAGIEEPGMDENAIPFSSHSGNYLTTHPTERFGCTLCHAGHGRVLEVQDVCGREGHDPSVSLQYVQALCAQCHLSLFADSVPSYGAEMLQSGLDLFRREGCLGCHKLRGVGGHVGPDLTDQGGKGRPHYNFRHTKGDHSVVSWLTEHFRDPEGVSPGSSMPAFDLREREMESLITFVLGQFSPSLPLDYYTSEVLQEFKTRRSLHSGREAYLLICSACHGASGEGKEFGELPYGAPSVGNVDFQAVASRELIEYAVWAGRGTSRMESWAPILSGLREEEIDRIVDHVRGFRQAGPSFSAVSEAVGTALLGRETFAHNCLPCHGETGEGGPGPSLNSQEFLSAASEKFLYSTIVFGRSNTAMPSWSALSAREISSLLLFLSTWQKESLSLPTTPIRSGDPKRGEDLFDTRCARCHGEFGEGGIGPAILNPDFLSAASDEYIGQTIARGRAHTPMFGWTRDLASGDRLGPVDLNDIVSFMRAREDSVLSFLPPGASTGRPLHGRELYRDLCSTCHGRTGEGTKGPTLNSQEFLSGATNGYLLATITLGRRGTAMPSWGRGTSEYRRLASQERIDIVAHLRTWQREVLRRDWVRGQKKRRR
jgi:mono/diheme cytochrome c family protein